MISVPVKTENQDLAERITHVEGYFGTISCGHQVAMLEWEGQAARANYAPSLGCDVLDLDGVAKLGAAVSVAEVQEFRRYPSPELLIGDQRLQLFASEHIGPLKGEDLLRPLEPEELDRQESRGSQADQGPVR